MKIDHLQAARLFLLARGRGGINEKEDLIALATLLYEFSMAEYNEAIENLGEIQKLIDDYGDTKINVGYFSDNSPLQIKAIEKCERLYQEIIKRLSLKKSKLI